MFKKRILLCSTIALTTLCGWAFGATTELTGIRTYNDVGHTRIVLDMKERPGSWDVDYNPEDSNLRIVLPETMNTNSKPVKAKGQAGVLRSVTLTPIEKDGLAIDIKAKQPVMHSLFVLENPDRMVIDLYTNYEQKTTTAISPTIDYTRWEKSGDRGRLKIYVGKVSFQGKSKVFTSATKEEMKHFSDKAKAPLLVSGDSTKTQTSNEISSFVGEGVFYASPDQGFVLEALAPTFVIKLDKRVIPTSGMNRERGKDELILFNKQFGASTKTNIYGNEVVLKEGKVIRLGKGDTAIGEEEVVLSGHGTQEALLAKVKLGQRIIVEMKPDNAFLGKAEALRGTLILKDKQILPQGTNDSSLRTKAFLGVNDKKEALLAIVEGEVMNSMGMTLSEGALLMKELGAEQAIALDYKEKAELWVKGSLVTQKDEEDKGTFVSALAFY